jgi:hypothetical protein
MSHAEWQSGGRRRARVISNLNGGALVVGLQLFAQHDGVRDLDAASF